MKWPAITSPPHRTIAYVAATLVALIIEGPAAAQELCGSAFTEKSILGVGRTPSSMVVRDIDADGDPDIVTTNDTDLSVTVLRNLGSRQFQLDPGYYIGARVGGLDAGDLDEDGRMDVVAGCHELDRLAILWGQADGYLGELELLPVPQNPHFVVIRDLDGDDHLDVAFLTDFQDSVQALWGDGSRTLGLQRSGFGVPVRPRILAVEDVSNDRLLDFMVTSCVDSTVYVLLGKGGRGFGTAGAGLQTPGLRPCGVAIGNLDQNASPDLAVVGNDLGSLSDHIPIALGTGTGSFTLTDLPIAGQLSSGVAIGDVNADSFGDVAVGNSFTDDVSLFSGRGDGTVAASVRLAVGDCPGSVEVVDLDGDSRPEVISLESCSSTITIVWNEPSLRTGQMAFSPDIHQLGIGGYTLRAGIDLTDGVASIADRRDIRLYWGGRLLGRAMDAEVVDSLAGRVSATFDAALLNELPLGVQKLTVLGCDENGVGFSATAPMTLLAGRRADVWQGSVLGRLPIAIMVPGAIGERIDLRIYDSGGRLVRTLSEPRLAGPIVWDGATDAGVKAPSGVYFAKASSYAFSGEGRIILVR